MLRVHTFFSTPEELIALLLPDNACECQDHAALGKLPLRLACGYRCHNQLRATLPLLHVRGPPWTPSSWCTCIVTMRRKFHAMSSPGLQENILEIR